MRRALRQLASWVWRMTTTYTNEQEIHTWLTHLALVLHEGLFQCFPLLQLKGLLRYPWAPEVEDPELLGRQPAPRLPPNRNLRRSRWQYQSCYPLRSSWPLRLRVQKQVTTEAKHTKYVLESVDRVTNATEPNETPLSIRQHPTVLPTVFHWQLHIPDHFNVRNS